MNMMNKILLAFSLTAVLALLLTLGKVDFSRDYNIVAFYLFFIFASMFAIFNLKKTILTVLAILPTVIIFHNVKINLGMISEGFRNITLPTNFTSLITVFLIYLAAIAVLTNHSQVRKIPLKSVILPYFAFVLLSFFWSNDLSAGLIGIIYSFGPLAIYILTNIYFTSKDDLLAIWLTVIGSSLGPVAIGLHQLAVKDFFYEPNSSLGRITGSFVHPNLFGLYLFIVIALLITLYSALGQTMASKNKLLAYSLPLSLVFVLTFSRTAWICALIFLTLFAFLEKQIFVLMGLLAPIALFMSVFINALRERIWGISNYIFFNSVIARQNIWRVSYKEIQKAPILGHGVGTAESVIDNAKDWVGGTSLPHNDFIMHALEFGIIGLLLYLNYVIQTVRKLFRVYVHADNASTRQSFAGLDFNLNFKTLAYGAFAIFLALEAATIFESVSREIILEISIWAIIGSLLANSKSPA